LPIFFGTFLKNNENTGAFMRRFFPPIILLLVVVYLSVTGFQCGSAEITTARLAITQKQWTKAEESLMKALQKNDKDEEAWFLLGQVRYELKKYAEMNEAYSNALAISDAHKPDIDKYRLSTWAEFFNAGIAYYNKGRDSAA
jgi:cytochrome c-type biogenesis protein CcmH/NrfG